MEHNASDRVVILKDFNGISGSKLNRNNLYFANKIISLGKDDERILYISRCKELVYKIASGVYLTMTDYSLLNKLFIELGLHKIFDISQYENFVSTKGIVTFAGKLDIEENQEDFVYLGGMQNPLEYEINPLDFTYQELIFELTEINKFIYKATKKGLYNGTIDENDIHKTLVKTNNHGYLDIIDILNHDSKTNEELCKKYARKIKLY